MTARQQTPPPRHKAERRFPQRQTEGTELGGRDVAAIDNDTRPGLFAGGVEGNQRLTATTGLLLILLLAALGVTILRIRPLINEHLFIGLLLIPPLGLKLASTWYRFMRYYTSNPAYRQRGAPSTSLRVLAPAVVIASIAVFATGVVLLTIGPSASGTLRELHKVSFIAWIALTSLHVIGHLPDIQKIFLTKRGGRVEYNELAAGRTGRTVVLAGTLLGGVVLAIVLVPQFGGWSHFEAFHHH